MVVNSFVIGVELISELLDKFPIGQTINNEENQKEFIRLYGSILRITNILTAFDDFAGQEILTERDAQDYRSMYLDFHDQFRRVNEGDKENINDDLVFEMELIKRVEVNINYILQLISKYHSHNVENKELSPDITRVIDSSVGLRNKKELIQQFVAKLSPNSSIEDAWHIFVNESKMEELDKIIAEEQLDHSKTYKFIKDAFYNEEIQASGTAIAGILPPTSRFDIDKIRAEMKQRVLDKLLSFFDKFFDISSDNLK